MKHILNPTTSILLLLLPLFAFVSFAVPCMAEVAYYEEAATVYPPYEPDDSVDFEILPNETEEAEDLLYLEGDPFGFEADETLAIEEDSAPYNSFAEELAATLGASVWYWNIVETGINAPTAAEVAAHLGINMTEGLAAASEAGISLEAATVAETGAVTGLTAAALYTVIFAEVVVVGTEVYLIYAYNEEIEEIADDYVAMGMELGQTEEEALAELEEDLYTENTYWDNFVDTYCLWCD